MSIRSSQRKTSGPSSESARKAARRAIRTAAASWSNPAVMCGRLVTASAQLRAKVVTRTRFCPLECWYWVMNWMQPLPPCGIGEPCYKKDQNVKILASKLKRWKKIWRNIFYLVVHFKENSRSSVCSECAEFPPAGSTETDFRFRDVWSLIIHRHTRTNRSTDF